MTIGQVPAGITVSAADKELSARAAKDVPDKTPKRQTDTESIGTEAYTLEINNAKTPVQSTSTTIKDETEAVSFAAFAKKSILQSPDNAVASLAFNTSRVAGLMSGFSTETAAT
ncbi:MAG: hypothetical protein L7F77_00790 [Candidatus Magnetominusculus sp. LBB02]|nr:hypothetical protein [Candidatus Magnetominusculus sp. LBB02]